MKAGYFSSVEEIGYYYVQSSSSITRTVNKEKDIKRAFDVLYHFDQLRATANKTIVNEYVKRKFMSYIANGG